MTHGEWAAGHYDRIVREANERGLTGRKLVMALAGMCGNLIALNFPLGEHEEMISFVRDKARSSLESELGKGQSRQ